MYPKESIKKMAEVSTAHLEQSDAELLDRIALQQMGYPGIVANYEEGFFVTVPLDPAYFLDDDQRIGELGFSQAYRRLLRDARGQGIRALWIDRDSDLFDDYPVFDW